MEKEITPKEYVENVEETLYHLLEKNKYKAIPFPNSKNDDKKDEKQLKRYYKIILSILYKQFCCNNGYDEEYNGLIRYIIEEIEKNINDNNLTQAYLLFASYSDCILKEMKDYFKTKHQNYILRKLSLQRIYEQKQYQELFSINPFMMHECYEYFLNPLTQEEQLIGEILEIQKSYNKKKPNSMAQNLLTDLKRKYKDNFDEVLMFIICNVYQNALKNDNPVLISLTKYRIENPKVLNKDIIDFFIDRENNNIGITDRIISVLQNFIKYNENIKEGELNHLKNQPSHEYVKKRLNKPN